MEEGQEGCICREGGRVKGGDGEVVKDGGCGLLREASANERNERGTGDAEGFAGLLLDGAGGDSEGGFVVVVPCGDRGVTFVVGDTGDIEGLVAG